MAFSKALYYPSIEIRDEGWLKTAILYWDEIKTIVPASMSEPYETPTCLELYHEGVLSPYHVNPEMESIRNLAGEVLEYIDSQEAEGIILERESRHAHIHPEKLPDFRRFVEMHPEKLAAEVEHRLLHLGRKRGEWLDVDEGFARFYMTLLATKLSEHAGLGLLTNLPSSDRFAMSARLDSRLFTRLRSPDPHWRRYHWHHYSERRMPSTLAQAMLSELTLRQVWVSPETPVRDILKFKVDYKSELGRFRGKLAELTKVVDQTVPLEALQQLVQDAYNNEFTPAMNDLRGALKGSGITCVVESFMKTSLLSLGTGSLLVNLGLGVPQALLASAGISLTASIVLFNLNRQEELRKNPYSYVLAAEKRFGR
jgi:hypothetical protein